jgi:hypothetical protein
MNVPVPIYEAAKVGSSGHVYYEQFQGYRIVAREETARAENGRCGGSHHKRLKGVTC